MDNVGLSIFGSHSVLNPNQYHQLLKSIIRHFLYLITLNNSIIKSWSYSIYIYIYISLSFNGTKTRIEVQCFFSYTKRYKKNVRLSVNGKYDLWKLKSCIICTYTIIINTDFLFNTNHHQFDPPALKCDCRQICYKYYIFPRSKRSESHEALPRWVDGPLYTTLFDPEPSDVVIIEDGFQIRPKSSAKKTITISISH